MTPSRSASTTEVAASGESGVIARGFLSCFLFYFRRFWARRVRFRFFFEVLFDYLDHVVFGIGLLERLGGYVGAREPHLGLIGAPKLLEHESVGVEQARAVREGLRR